MSEPQQDMEAFVAQLGIQTPSQTPPKIGELKEIRADGPYRTKSNADLTVRFVFGEGDALTFFTYSDVELSHLPCSIRGLREYEITGLQRGANGGNEYHRIRQEIVLVTRGIVRWTLDDLHGGVSIRELHAGEGIWLQPFILHAYHVVENDSALQVIANTIFFNPDDKSDPRTHDTYSADAFRALQKRY